MRRLNMSIREVNIGTRLELEVTDSFNSDKSYSYVSQLLDIKDDENIVIAAPIIEGRLAFVPNNSRIAVILNHPRYGLIAFDGTLISKENQDTVAVFYLQLSGEFYKIQRRNNYRLEIMLDVQYCELKDNAKISHESIDNKLIKIYTRNISGSGACIVTNADINVGTKLYLRFELPDGTEIETKCVVVRSVRVENAANPKYNVGVRFLSMDKKQEDRLIRFIFMKQKEILKQKRM